MTKEEAIRQIENRWSIMDYGESEALGEALDMAIEALRREIPKNPVVNFVSDADGSRRLDEGWVDDALLCPVCHTYFGELFNEGYCRECGQKLIQKRVRVIKK